MTQKDHRELIRLQESIGHAEYGVKDVATRNVDADLYEAQDLLKRANDIVSGRIKEVQEQEHFVYS